MADETKWVKVSVEKHIESELGSNPIHWQGTRFRTDNVSAWLEPRLLGFSAAIMQGTERFEDWTLNVNCYAKRGEGEENTHKVWELADEVFSAFNRVTVAVQDFDSVGDPTVAHIRFKEVSVTPVPASGGRPQETAQLQQVNASVEGRIIN